MTVTGLLVFDTLFANAYPIAYLRGTGLGGPQLLDSQHVAVNNKSIRDLWLDLRHSWHVATCAWIGDEKEADNLAFRHDIFLCTVKLREGADDPLLVVIQFLGGKLYIGTNVELMGAGGIEL